MHHDAARRADYYDDPWLYDVLHAPGTAEDVAVIERLARRHVRTARRSTKLNFLEPACGSGRYVIALARRGNRAAGFDLSAGMIAYACERAARLKLSRRATFFEARMERFRAPFPADVAINPINSIRHLGSDRAMRTHLDAVRRALRPGGVGIYIVGISLCAYGLEQETEDVWKARRAGLRVSQVVQYLPPPAAGAHSRRTGDRREQVISHITVRRGESESHVDSTYWLRSYNRAQWERLIDSAGWSVLEVANQEGRRARVREPGYFNYVLAPGKRSVKAR